MASGVRFIGGPVDGDILPIPDEEDVFFVFTSPCLLDCSVGPMPSGDLPIVVLKHEYRRAFEGSVYFKYQGESNGN